MSSGPRTVPPALPSFRHVGYLGGGGFADVFLYEQVRPARQVAVKVLKAAALDDAARSAFDAEADLMARVSTHPYIVTIFGADLAPDGRPYLVMEYYPKPHLGLRMRSAPMPVTEVLQAGVHLAGAVETAHRAGILHRDIKPANVLVSQYGRLGLTDFGIAEAAGASEHSAATGYSVPYAAPEVLRDETDGDARTEVYALAATLYALLAGRAPHEIPGGVNSNAALGQRALSSAAPRTGRADVPEALELLLGQALARDAQLRPSSVAELGRALQGIERQLGHAPTDLVIDDSSASNPHLLAPTPADDEDSTRAAPIQVVRQAPSPDTVARSRRGPEEGSPSTPPGGGDPALPAPVPIPRAERSPDADATRGRLRVPSPPPTPDTVARPAKARPPTPEPESSPSVAGEGRSRQWWALGAGLVLLAVVAVVVVIARGGSGDDPSAAEPEEEVVDPNALAVPDIPPVPTDVTVVVDGASATISWSGGGGAEEGDTYAIFRTDGDGSQAPLVATSSPAQVPVQPGERPCFEIAAQRGSRPSMERSREVCAP